MVGREGGGGALWPTPGRGVDVRMYSYLLSLLLLLAVASVELQRAADCSGREILPAPAARGRRVERVVRRRNNIVVVIVAVVCTVQCN